MCIRDRPGTVITGKNPHNLPPIIVYKRTQVLITLESKDFSFVEGKPVHTLYEILNNVKIKPNLTQNAAISLFVCVDDIQEKISEVALQAAETFDVQLEKNLTLLTIR